MNLSGQVQMDPRSRKIAMHSNSELEQIFHERIVERVTVHEWPLSSVQRITFQSGQRVAYKAQLPPTVEPEFYQRAQSSLLPDYRILGEVENCTTMAIGWIEHPSLQSCNLDVDMLVTHGRQVVSHISRLDEDLPVHLNVGTSSKWISAVEK